MTENVFHIKVEFNDEASGVHGGSRHERYYLLDEKTLRKTEAWLAKQEEVPPQNMNSFLNQLALDGARLHREDGPAVIDTYSDGARHEAWLENGEYHREDGPAVVKTFPNGMNIREWYWHNQRRHEGGPAIVTTFADGSRDEISYFEGKQLKIEKFRDLFSVPGVSVPPPAPPAP